jgi:hypothetical protein
VALSPARQAALGCAYASAFQTRLSCHRNVSHDQRVEGFKPSVDLILMEGDIGKKKTSVKIVDEAVRHFDRIDLLVHSQIPPML